jgi:hypothetical protein
VRPGILREILLFCRESAKWWVDRSNARNLMMKNICELTVASDELKYVDSMVKLACFVEENGMDRGGRNVIGERKRCDDVSR